MFWLAPLLRVFLLALAALILGYAVQPLVGSLALIIGLVGIHCFHLVQLRRLTNWLSQDGSVNSAAVPESFGTWGNAYASLYRSRRNDQAGRELLSASLERFRQAAEAMPDGIVILDEHLKIGWCNTAAKSHLGLDVRRDCGTPVTHLVRYPEFSAYMAEHGNEPLILRGVASPSRVLSISLILFAESSLLLISRDVTAIDLADTVRRDFVANVSHELRTPLTVIVGLLEGLVEGESDAVTKRSFVLMNEQALRMERLVKDLLELSKLDEGTAPPNEEWIKVSDLLEELLAEGHALSNGAHAFHLEAARDGLFGNRDELRSAFGNLISNAIRYTPSGGSISIRWAVKEKGAVFEVTDSGIGIAEEHIPRLTERFYRVDKGRSSETGGTGLGLAIAKHVLIRHQAKLEIESSPGKGSLFRVLFPGDRVGASSRIS